MAGIPYAPIFGFKSKNSTNTDNQNIFAITAGKVNVVPLVWNADDNNKNLDEKTGAECFRFRFNSTTGIKGGNPINVYYDVAHSQIYGKLGNNGLPYGGYGNLAGGVVSAWITADFGAYITGEIISGSLEGRSTYIQLERYNNYGASGFSNLYNGNSNGVKIVSYHKPFITNLKLYNGNTATNTFTVNDKITLKCDNVKYWGKNVESWDRSVKVRKINFGNIVVKSDSGIENPNIENSFVIKDNSSLMDYVLRRGGDPNSENNNSNEISLLIISSLSHIPNKNMDCNDKNGNPIVKHDSSGKIQVKPYAEVSSSVTATVTVRPNYKVTNITNLGLVTNATGMQKISWSKDAKETMASGYKYYIYDLNNDRRVFESGFTEQTFFYLDCEKLEYNHAYSLEIRPYYKYNNNKWYSSTTTTLESFVVKGHMGFNGKPKIILPSRCKNNTMYWFKDIFGESNNPFRFVVQLPRDKEYAYLDSHNLPRFADIVMQFENENGEKLSIFQSETEKTGIVSNDGIVYKEQYWSVTKDAVGSLGRSIPNKIVFQLNAGEVRNIFKSNKLKIRCGVSSVLGQITDYTYSDWVTVYFDKFPTESDFKYRKETIKTNGISDSSENQLLPKGYRDIPYVNCNLGNVPRMIPYYEIKDFFFNSNTDRIEFEGQNVNYGSTLLGANENEIFVGQYGKFFGLGFSSLNIFKAGLENGSRYTDCVLSKDLIYDGTVRGTVNNKVSLDSLVLGSKKRNSNIMTNIPQEYRLGRVKIYRNNELLYDFKPCINPSNIVGFYEYVSNEFIRSETDLDWGTEHSTQSNIPNGYQSLDYVEFNSDVQGDVLPFFELDYKYVYSTDTIFINSQSINGNQPYIGTQDFNEISLGDKLFYFKTDANIGSFNKIKFFQIGYESNNNGVYENGIKNINASNVIGNKNSECNFCIGTTYSKDSKTTLNTRGSIRYRLGNIMITRNRVGVLYDFAPCISPSGEIGFYETISGKFYTSTSGNNWMYKSTESEYITPNLPNLFLGFFDYTKPIVSSSFPIHSDFTRHYKIIGNQYEDLYSTLYEDILNTMKESSNPSGYLYPSGGIGQPYMYSPIQQSLLNRRGEFKTLFNTSVANKNPIVFKNKVTEHGEITSYTQYPSDWSSHYKDYFVVLNRSDDYSSDEYSPLIVKHCTDTTPIGSVLKVDKPNLWAFYYSLFFNLAYWDGYTVNPHNPFYRQII